MNLRKGTFTAVMKGLAFDLDDQIKVEMNLEIHTSKERSVAQFH
jgi:hypothetical protein